MNAQEAQKLTREALSDRGALGEQMKQIYQSIAEQARNGERHIHIAWKAFGGSRADGHLSFTQREAVVQVLRNLGYKADTTSDQRDGDFLSIEW